MILNKYFICLGLLAGMMPLGSFAQNRQADLSVQVTSPVNQAEITWGDTAICSFYLKNNGPDAIVTSDTIELKAWHFNIPIEGMSIAAGDSIPFNNVVKLWNDDSTSDASATFCVEILGHSSGFADSFATNDSSCVDFTVKGLAHTGIGNLRANKKEGIVVYPNPANNFLIIKSANSSLLQSLNIQIINFLGKVIIRSSSNHNLNGEWRVNLSEVPNGIYLLNVRGRDISYQQKIMVHKK